MHLAALDLFSPEDAPPETPQPQAPRPVAPAGGIEGDKELMRIFEKTYGQVKPRSFQPPPKPRSTSENPRKVHYPPAPTGPECLLVDGYNIIFAWDELKALAREDLDAARQALMDILSNYQGFRQNRIILIFDAYKVPQGTGSVIPYHGITVVYTKEAETADSYIEKASYQLSGENYRVRVATSDAAEQFVILGHGALRMSAQELRASVEQAQGEIAAILRKNNIALPRGNVKDAFDRAKKPPKNQT